MSQLTCPTRTNAGFFTQWAAVNTKFLDMMLAPQANCVDPLLVSNRAAMCGNSPSYAAVLLPAILSWSVSFIYRLHAIIWREKKKRMQFNGGWMKEFWVKNRLSFTHQTQRYGPRIAYEWLFRLNCWQAVTQSALWYCKTTTKTWPKTKYD